MQIIPADERHIHKIIDIARETWQHTYTNIISQQQIDYMLNLFYTAEGIREQLQTPGHHFFIALRANEILGYAHAIENEQDEYSIKLSKLYVYPHTQGGGAGKLLMQAVEAKARKLLKRRIILNVNRMNPAKDFYFRQGFSIVQEIDIPLAQYWLNDYIMEKNLFGDISENSTD